MAEVNGEELVDVELLVGEERERSPSPVSSAPERGKLRDLDGIDRWRRAFPKFRIFVMSFSLGQRGTAGSGGRCA